MFTIAALVTALCAAIPVATLIRMWATGRRTRADIRIAMTQLRQTTPTSTQGATSSAKTPAAPCHPDTRNEHEVHTS
ncbi:hypothetical protein AB0L44_26065 [Nonomuraea wenchangensis]|uniref:hypothetical protein n=1 Tax=Nonomuraea wenchangensis TaxID=568860 RepID=UPI003437F885